MRADIPSVTLLGVRVARLSEADALEEIARLYDEGGPAIVAFANAHTLNVAYVEPDFARVLSEIDLLLNDGSGLAIAARLRGDSFLANLNGTDLTPLVLDLAATRGARVFLLGGREGVAAQALYSLAEIRPDLQVVGARSGYIEPGEVDAVIDEIRAARTDVLVVGMGNPLQEHWLAEHLAATGARLGLAVGAFIDFQAGVVKRSPVWMRRCGIEWMYRLRLEPRRLGHRYLVGNPRFLSRAWRTRRAGSERVAVG